MTTLTAATPSMGGGMSAAGRMGRPQAQAQAGFAGMTGADFLRIIRQRLLLILAIWFLSMVTAAVATILLIKHRPLYLAKAYVRVESVEPVNPLQPLDPGGLQAADLQRVVSDQAVMMKNPSVLAKALNVPELKSTAWYRDAVEREGNWSESKIDLLDEAVSAVPVKDTSYLVVSARTRQASEAPILANVVVDTYISEVRKQQEDDIRRSKEDLDDELDIANQQYKAHLDDLEQFRATRDVLGVGNETNEELQTLSAVETELKLDLVSKESIWETLKNAGPDSPIIPPELEAMVNQDYTVRAYDAEVLRAEQELSSLKTNYGVNHRAVKRTQMQYDSVLSALNEERAAKLFKYKSEMVEQARINYLEAQHTLVKVQDQLEDARAEQRDRDADMAVYLRKLDEADIARQNQEQLQQQRDFVNIVLRGKNKLKIEKLPAVEPKKRYSPRWEIWMPGGALLGIVLGVGLALLLDIADKSVRTPRDISRHMVIPVLGTIPTSDDDEIEIERVETATIDAPHSIVAEAFRRLRANLFFSAPAEQQGVLMVTSPSAGNGKTTISTNLAISIALSGRRVLLVDANFRRPGVPRTFPHESEQGLSNVLIGRARLDDVVFSTGVPGLDVVSAGPTPPNPAELLGSSYLRDLVVDARSRYDQIIFDGPPVLLVSDAAVLAGAMDGVLMVCQYRVTSRGALQRARSQLDAINTRVFGAVLNMVETRAGGYFRKHYREFYDYQEPEEGGPVQKAQIESHPAAAATVETKAVPPNVPRGHSPAGAIDAERDFEPEPTPEFLSTDASPLPTEGLDWADKDDDLGDVRIDESLGLGDDIEDDGPFVTPVEEDSTALEDLDFGDDIKLDPNLDLGDELNGDSNRERPDDADEDTRRT